jgi:hypothetical protein
MCRNARAIYPFFRRLTFFALVVSYFLLSPSPVYAGTGGIGGGISVTPISAVYTSPAAAGGVNTSAGYLVGAGQYAGNGGYISRPVTVGNGTLGGLARGALFRVGPVLASTAIMTGIIAAAGYGIDSLRQQIQTPGSPRDMVGGKNMWLYQNRYASTRGGAWGLIRSNSAFSDAVPYRSEPALECLRNEDPNKPNFNSYSCAILVFVLNPVPDYSTGSDPSPVSDGTLGALVSGSGNPDLINGLLSNPSGQPYMTPELTADTNALRQSLEASTGAPPAPNLTPPANASTSAPAPAKPTPFPVFCEWARVVCEFIGWVKTEPVLAAAPLLPIVDEVAPSSGAWVAPIGSAGSCPAAIVVPVMGSTATFEFTPLCMFATYARPVIIFLGLVLSAYILAGARVQ